jgi:Gpi18-like mannosyltransferase
VRGKNFILLLFVAFAGAWIFMPGESHGHDVGCVQRWAIFIRSNGLGRAYEVEGLDYNPLFLELLWLFGRIQGSVEGLQTSFVAFKVFVLLFDFGAVALTAYLLRCNGRNVALACLLLFNPAFFYNTAFWGQVDAIFSLFVVLSIVLATRRMVVASLLCVLLAVNFKLVAAVFVPLVVLLNLPTIRDDRRLLLRAIPLLLAVQVVIFLPFLERQRLAALVAANLRQLESLGVTSPSGFNFWWIVFGDRTYEVQASVTFLHISYKTWGVVMFGATVATALVPLIKTLVLEKKPLDDAYVFLASAVYWLAFYFFTTGMRERYGHPAVLLLGIYAVLSGRYAAYVLASIALFLNLEVVLKFFNHATQGSRIFKGAFVGGLFCVVLVVGVIALYRERRERSAVL